MKKKTTIRLAIIAGIILVTLRGLFYFQSAKRSSNTFTGTVTSSKDCSANIGASSCTWQVQVNDTDTRTVYWSQSVGADSSATGGPSGFEFTDDITGKQVEVYGEKTGDNSYSVSQKGYYIKLTEN